MFMLTMGEAIVDWFGNTTDIPNGFFKPLGLKASTAEKNLCSLMTFIPEICWDWVGNFCCFLRAQLLYLLKGFALAGRKKGKTDFRESMHACIH